MPWQFYHARNAETVPRCCCFKSNSWSRHPMHGSSSSLPEIVQEFPAWLRLLASSPPLSKPTYFSPCSQNPLRLYPTLGTMPLPRCPNPPTLPTLSEPMGSLPSSQNRAHHMPHLCLPLQVLPQAPLGTGKSFHSLAQVKMCSYDGTESMSTHHHPYWLAVYRELLLHPRTC